MKIQCACGAKYAFDVTPEMVAAPIQLICQACGADNSAAVNQLIRQQFNAPAPTISVTVVSPAPARTDAPSTGSVPAPRVAPPAPPVRIATPSPENPGPVAPPSPAKPALRVNVAAATSATTPAEAPVSTCAKHPDQPVTQHCRVCQKPMCSKCMEAFGFVCSAYCKGKAENQGMEVPRFAGQRSAVQSRQTRWIGRAMAGAFAVFVITIGVWAWYTWIGSVPKVSASLRFTETGHSGQIHVINGNQAVLLHGGRVIRYDFKAGNELWSHPLIDEQKIVNECKVNYERASEARMKIISAGGEVSGHLGTLEELIDYTKRSAAAELHLHARGEAVWVSAPGKLTRYDWQSGNTITEVKVPEGERQLVANGDELLIRVGAESVTTLNLTSGETSIVRAHPDDPAGAATRTTTGQPPGAGVTPAPARPGSVRPVSTPARLVAPALAAISNNQQRLETEMRNPSAPSAAATGTAVPGAPRLIATRHGIFELIAKPVGQRTVNGESASFYNTTVRSLSGSGSGQGEWTGDVPGLPELHALPSVTLLVGDRTVIALDKTLKKIWEKRLEGGVRYPSLDLFVPENDLDGEGPCIEHDGVVFVCDRIGMTAFDARTGEVRWRLATPDIYGIVFGDGTTLYANSTIAAGDQTHSAISKIDGSTGKPIWRIEREGAIAYVSGPFVYALESYKGDDDAADGVEGFNTVFHVSPYVRIKRIEPASGRVLWHHFQQRFPLDVRFDRNTFQILFKKEAQLLKFISL